MPPPDPAFQPHAEKLPFFTFAAEAGVTIERALALLEEMGILVSDPEEQTSAIVERSDLSPMELFEWLSADRAIESRGST